MNIDKIIQIQEDYKHLKIQALQYCSSDAYILKMRDHWARDILDNVIDKQNFVKQNFDWYEVMISISADDIKEMIDIFESDVSSNPNFVEKVMLGFKEVA